MSAEMKDKQNLIMQQQIQRSTKKLFLIETKDEENESDGSEDSDFIRQAYRVSQGIPSV